MYNGKRNAEDLIWIKLIFVCVHACMYVCVWLFCTLPCVGNVCVNIIISSDTVIHFSFTLLFCGRSSLSNHKCWFDTHCNYWIWNFQWFVSRWIHSSSLHFIIICVTVNFLIINWIHHTSIYNLLIPFETCWNFVAFIKLSNIYDFVLWRT